MRVFSKRFASKEFAQFDLIVKEFSRLAAPHLASDPVVAAGFGVAGAAMLEETAATEVTGGAGSGVALCAVGGCQNMAVTNPAVGGGSAANPVPVASFV